MKLTVDREAGLVYVPVEDPTDDAYGGARPGNDLYGDSIVCLDINTGKPPAPRRVGGHRIRDHVPAPRGEVRGTSRGRAQSARSGGEANHQGARLREQQSGDFAGHCAWSVWSSVEGSARVAWVHCGIFLVI